jgi:hypothetical protein
MSVENARDLQVVSPGWFNRCKYVRNLLCSLGLLAAILLGSADSVSAQNAVLNDGSNATNTALNSGPTASGVVNNFGKGSGQRQRGAMLPVSMITLGRDCDRSKVERATVVVRAFVAARKMTFRGAGRQGVNASLAGYSEIGGPESHLYFVQRRFSASHDTMAAQAAAYLVRGVTL